MKACVWMVSLAAWLTACAESGRKASIETELAPSPGAPTITTTPCLQIQVCRPQPAGDCETATLFSVDGGSVQETTDTFFVEAAAGDRVSFDAALTEGTYDLVAHLYAAQGDGDGMGPFVHVASGRTRSLRLGTDVPRLRLYRPGRTSLGPAEDATPAPRAFHRAVQLPNGDVLFLGGVHGDSVARIPEGPGAILQRGVQVYVSREHRFADVEVQNSRGETSTEGFGRAMFDVALLSGPADGPYRLWSIGGLTAPEDGEVLRFDLTQQRPTGFQNRLTSPVVVAPDAQHAPDALLVYDPRARTLRLQPLSSSNPRSFVTATGFLSESASAQAAVLTAVEQLGASENVFDPTLAVDGALWIERGEPGADPRVVAGNALSEPRFGGGIALLSEGTALVWGGNVRASEADTDLSVGELIRPREGARLVTATGDQTLPTSTAFGIVAPVGAPDDRGVLVAGGLRITNSSGLHITTAVTTEPPQVLRSVDGTFGELEVHPVSDPGGGFASVFFGHALSYPTGNDPTNLAVLLTGGIARQTGQPLGFAGSHRVALIVSTSSGYAVQPLAQDISFQDGLIEGRWGHTVTALADGRLLIMGGFREAMAQLQAVASPEVLDTQTQCPEIASCDSAAVPQGACAPLEEP